MSALDEIKSTIAAEFGFSLEKVESIGDTVNEMIALAKAKGFNNAEALSLFGTCANSIIESAPSHADAMRIAAGFTTALWRCLGIDIEFAVPEMAEVDASELN